jgi:hypothetical protein
LGSLDTDKGCAGKERHGDQQDGKQDAAGAGSESAAEGGFVEETFDALGEIAGSGHGDS